MDTAITIGMLVEWMLVVGGIFGVLFAAFFVLSLLNPFRSGH